MALEFFHGFDNCNGAADFMKYGWLAAINPSFATGRFGGATKALTLSSSGDNEDEATGRRVLLALSGNLQRIIGGETIRFTHSGQSNLSNAPNIKNRVIKFMDGNGDTNANVQIGIGCGPNGTLRVWRGDTQVFESAPNVFLLSTWHRLEWDLVIDATVGSLTLRVDGVTIPGLTGLTNTRNTANAYANVFRLNTPGDGPTVSFGADHDDLVLMNSVNDGTGMNTWKGDVRCDLLVPTGDFQKQFTPNSGTTCYTQIDEPIPSTTDYVDGVAGLEDIYDLTDLGTLSLVHALQVNSQGYRTGTTFFNHTPKLYTNASNASLSAMVLAGTTGNFKRVSVLNPITGIAWTPAEINALRLGMLVT